MRDFKIRASKASDLLANGRAKDSVGDTCMTYLKEWTISELTGKKKSIDSKYLRKGIEVENKSIERISKLLGVELSKNSIQLENEWFTGEFDTRTEDTVIDAKSSWDAFTFPYFMDVPPKNYVVQLQVYMNLTGLRKAKLCYCLENGTEEMIERLSWQKAKQAGFDEPDINHWNEAEQELNYDHLPDSMRIKCFDIEYDETIIEALKKRVEWSRAYIKDELLTKIK